LGAIARNVMSEPSLAVPDGMRLSDWWESRAVPRSTAFRLLRIAGIEPEKVRADGSRSPVSFLSQPQVDALDALAAKVKGGASITQLEGALAVHRRPETAPDPIDEPDATPPGPDLLLDRLEAGERALRSGLPLSTSEVAWIIGARPGSATVTRGRIVATRHGRNVWTLSRLEG
jgi:hypothetical protein